MAEYAGGRVPVDNDPETVVPAPLRCVANLVDCCPLVTGTVAELRYTLFGLVEKNMVRKLVLIAAAVVAFGSIAFAADLPLKAPPIAAMHGWSGCYLGGGGGYAYLHENHQVLFPAPVIGLGGATSLSDTTNASGGFGTGQVGCDYQIERWVIGVFADADFDHISSQYDSWTFANRGQSYAGGDLALKWSWAVGGRIGYLISPKFLAYAGAGFSSVRFDEVRYAYTRGGNTGIDTGVVMPATTFNGFFVAAGIEYMLSNGFFIKGEYRYADYGTKGVQQICTDVAVCFGPEPFLESIHPTVQTVRAELVWKLNGR